MDSAFWSGFEKKAFAGMIAKTLAKPFLSAGANLGRIAAKKPMATAGGLLTAAEGVSVASEASKHTGLARKASKAMGAWKPAGGTF